MLNLSLFVLVIYAGLLFYFDDGNWMGVVISLSITFMDMYNYSLHKNKIIENATSLNFLLILNRITMVILGETYWVYGFMGLYMLYSVALLYLTSR